MSLNYYFVQFPSCLIQCELLTAKDLLLLLCIADCLRRNWQPSYAELKKFIQGGNETVQSGLARLETLGVISISRAKPRKMGRLLINSPNHYVINYEAEKWSPTVELAKKLVEQAKKMEKSEPVFKKVFASSIEFFLEVESKKKKKKNYPSEIAGNEVAPHIESSTAVENLSLKEWIKNWIDLIENEEITYSVPQVLGLLSRVQDGELIPTLNERTELSHLLDRLIVRLKRETSPLSVDLGGIVEKSARSDIRFTDALKEINSMISQGRTE